MNAKKTKRTSNSKPGRGFGLWIILVSMLAIAAFGWFRFVRTLTNQEMLILLKLPVSLAYLAITGLIWGISGLTAVAGIWLRKTTARLFSQWLFPIFLSWYIIDTLVFTRTTSASRNLPFLIGLDIMGTAVIVLLYKLPKQKRYFHIQQEEQETQNEESGN